MFLQFMTGANAIHAWCAKIEATHQVIYRILGIDEGAPNECLIEQVLSHKHHGQNQKQKQIGGTRKDNQILFLRFP